MCGISSLAYRTSHKNISDIVRLMLDKIKYRGPDHTGFMVDGDKIALGNVRLSIIDLNTGNQPMSNKDGSLTIVFNGEIYNYRELRKGFLSGVSFKTASDTETILYMYEKLGYGCLRYLNGMFALCIYDKRKNELFFARDRAGKKPLYYHFNDKAMIAGSEMKSVTSALNNRPEISRKALHKYLFYDNIPDPSTIYTDIKRLPAGCYIKFDLDKWSLKIENYWSPCFSHSYDYTEYESLARFDGLINNAIKYRLISDVPLGLFLSGGIDSTLALEYVVRNRKEPISTFTIGFEDKTFDESEYADLLAKHYGTIHHARVIGKKDLVDNLYELLNFIDEPFADYSLIPTYLLSRFSRQYVKAVISGDGGDELFNGYPTFFFFPFWRLFSTLPRNIIDSVSALISVRNVAGNYYPFNYKFRKCVRSLLFKREVFNQVLISSFDPDEIISLGLAPPFEGENNSGQSVVQANNEYIYEDLSRLAGKLDRTLVSEFYFNFYLRSVLYKVDRASMYASLEARAPLLDRSILDFIPRMDWSFKSNYHDNKILLKKLLRSRVPDQILRRKKHGFAIPVSRWLREDISGLVKELLSRDALKKHSLFNITAIENMVREHLGYKADHGKKLWNLLIFQAWYYSFHEKLAS